MHLGYAILHQRQVPIIVEQPGLDAGDVRGQPFAVAERHEHVLPAVHQQDRDGDVGRKAMPSCWQYGTTSASASRVHSDSSDCTDVTGWTDRARLISSTVTSDRPMCRALPAATVSAIAPQVSSSGTCGSTRCSW